MYLVRLRAKNTNGEMWQKPTAFGVLSVSRFRQVVGRPTVLAG